MIFQNHIRKNCRSVTAECVVFMLFFFHPIFSQSQTPVIRPGISIRKFDASDGLDFAGFKSITKDSLGTLWFIGEDLRNFTDRKYLRIGNFDGVRFRSYPLDSSEWLTNGYNYAGISMLEENKVLIHTMDNDHLYYYDFGQKKTVEIRYQSKSLIGLTRGQIWKGKYYFSFKNQGVPTIAMLDGLTVKPLFSAEKLAEINAVYLGEEGIWVCNTEEFVLFDFSGKIIERKTFPQSLRPFFVSQKTSKGLEVLPLNAPAFYLDNRTYTMHPMPYLQLDKQGLASGIYEDKRGNLLYIYSYPYNLKYVLLLTKEGTLYDLSDISETIPQVAGIYGDDFLQSFWVVNAFNLYKVQLSGISVSQHLLTSAMRKIQLGSDGKLYASTETGGTFVSELGRQLSFKSVDNNLFVRYFEVTKNGDIFTNSNTLFRRVKNGVEHEVPLDGFAFDIVPIGDSMLFASCLGIAEIIQKYPLKTQPLKGVSFESTHQVLPMGGQGVMVAYKDGVAAFDLKTKQIRQVFAGEPVTSLCRDSDETWWFGSEQGKFIHYSPMKMDTLLQLGTPIVSITKDGDGRLWLGTFKGVYVYELKGKNLFKIDDQLLSHPECNRLSAFYDAKYNRMMIGTVRGMNVIDIDKINLSKTELNLHLSFLHYFNKETEKTDTLDFRNETNYSIKLDAYHRNLTVGFAPGVSGENNYDYYYALVPSGGNMPKNIDWRNNGSNAEISLTNLESGTYRLLVKAKTDLSETESNLLTVNILVADYFYNQWWFYGLLTATLAGLVLWWQRHLRSENIRLESEVEKRTAELQKDKETIQHQAEELTKLDEMKTQFYNNISHELKTPLSLILAPLESIKQGHYIADKKGNAFLDLIDRNASLLQDRVEELLELTRLENHRISVHNNPVDMTEFMDNNCRIFSQEAERIGIDLKIEAKTAYDHLVFDEKKVGKIVQNLIANALKYCPKGSHVNVLVETEEHQLRLVVEDNGPGIPAEHQPSIFEKFYQVSSERQHNPGSGIGLSIVKEYVDLMGGTVTLTSPPLGGRGAGTGTKFEITIPVSVAVVSPKVESAENEAFATSTLIPPKGERPAHLLVVEDNEDLRKFLSLLLSERFQLTLATNGAEAIRLLENGLPVDIILSDIMMPQVDGMGLLNHVKRDERLRNLPFIFLTAKTNELTKLSALRLGVDDYLTKPFSEKELLLRIHRLLHNYEIRKTTAAELEVEISEPINDGTIFTLQNFVREKLTDPTFNVESIAEQMNMSARNLQRFMQREVGMSPKDFIIEVQMNLLRELRSENKKSTLRELAAQVGYTDHKYMSKQFYERFGYRL
ncbi:MAG: response regulator [Bacteroidetes bacterium]|nr:response regulator [Bacteroidota bacterium]